MKATNAITLRKVKLRKQDANLLQGAIDSRVTSADGVPDAIRVALQKRLVRVVDLFRQLDDDGNGTVDGPEFVKALYELGLDADESAVAAVFESLDADGSGTIEYAELHGLLVRSVQDHPHLPPLDLKATNAIKLRKKRVKFDDASLLQTLDLTDAPNELIPVRIRAALQERYLRVIDVFRQM